eukprot:403340757
MPKKTSKQIKQSKETQVSHIEVQKKEIKKNYLSEETQQGNQSDTYEHFENLTYQSLTGIKIASKTTSSCVNLQMNNRGRASPNLSPKNRDSKVKDQANDHFDGLASAQTLKSTPNRKESDSQNEEENQSQIVQTADQQTLVQTPKQLQTLEQELENEELKLKKINLRIRNTMGAVLMSSGLAIICMGHLFTQVLIVFIIFNIYNEILSVTDNIEANKKTKFGYVQYLNLLIMQFLFFPHFVIKRSFLDDITQGETFLQLIFFKYHFLISILLLAFSLVFVSINLIRYNNFNYQVTAWAKSILMSLILTFSASCYFYSLFQGYFWFIFSIFAVAWNDIFAHQVGLRCGRTPLISLSPKKTREGFIGGIIGSLIVGFICSKYISQVMFFVCPKSDLDFAVFPKNNCEIPVVFVPRLEVFDMGIFGEFSINIAPVQIHAFVITLWVAFIAPFGGFLASGFKRAFKVKDFADKIPGHGGVTDRFDCKILTGAFIFFYLTQIVYREETNVESAYKHFQQMELNDQTRLLNQLTQIFSNLNNTQMVL